jgi:hypothetical protein
MMPLARRHDPAEHVSAETSYSILSPRTAP